MFCGKCGKFVEEGNKFCTGCGEKVTPINSNYINEVQPSINESTSTNPIDLGKSNQGNSNYDNLNSEDEVVCKTQDKVNVWLVILGFFIPVVGLILFVTLKKNTPKKANAIGIAALVGFVLGIILSVVVIVFIVIMTASEYYNYYDDYNDYYDNYYNDYHYYDDYDFEEQINKLEKEFDKYYNENRI